MIKNFVNKLLILVILSIGGNVVNASDNITNSDVILNNSTNKLQKMDEELKNIKINNSETDTDSDKSNKNSWNNSCSNSPKITDVNEIMHSNSETNNNENNIVHYEPDKMWFDYQALLDNTRNAMLKENKTETKYVRHTEFAWNKIALHALFNSDEFNDGLLDSAMSGNLFPQYSLLENFTDYIRGIYNYDELESLNDEQLRIVGLNYKWFVGILASLGDDTNNEIVSDYMQLIHEYPVSERISRLLNIGKEVNKL